MSKKIKTIYIYTCLSLMLFGALILAFWSFWPYKILDIKQPLEVLTKEVKPGEHLKLRFNYCNYVKVPVTTTAYFIEKGPSAEHVIDQIAPKTSTSQIRCQNVVSDKYVIPQNYIPGVYYIKIEALYQLNPVRTEKITIISGDFMVK